MTSQPYSLLVPHIFMNIPMEKIKSSFERLDLGKVERIDSVIKISREGYKYRMAFIHFEYWNMNNEAGVNLKEKIENPNKEARLVYDDPWYWLLLPNKSYLKKNSDQIERLQCLFEDHIKRIENEVDCIYEELYQREYIPNNKQPEWLNSSSDRFAPIHPMNDCYDESYSLSSVDSMSYNSDIDDEINEIYKNRYISNMEEKLHLAPSRAWMTMNVCDNA